MKFSKNSSNKKYLLKNSSHFHLETTVCTATKESIVARVARVVATDVFLVILFGVRQTNWPGEVF